MLSPAASSCAVVGAPPSVLDPAGGAVSISVMTIHTLHIVHNIHTHDTSGTQTHTRHTDT
jgi:hypothetical protein